MNNRLFNKTQLGALNVIMAVAAFSLSACAFKHADPHFVYAPDMHYNPSLKAQEPGAMRPPVAGTMPRGFKPYHITDIEEAGKTLKNPLPRTKTNILQGQKLYNVYCIVCHGPMGEGDGTVVPKYPRPPTLQSEKIRDFADGKIFHVITMGQNLMPSYADRVAPEERWAIVHYIRALYKAKHPTAADLKAAESYIEDLK